MNIYNRPGERLHARLPETLRERWWWWWGFRAKTALMRCNKGGRPRNRLFSRGCNFIYFNVLGPLMTDNFHLPGIRCKWQASCKFTYTDNAAHWSEDQLLARTERGRTDNRRRKHPDYWRGRVNTSLSLEIYKFLQLWPRENAANTQT